MTENVQTIFTNLIPFVSILGVLLGFLLAWVKESIQNRPKLKFNLKKFSLNQSEGVDENGYEILPSPIGATQMDIEILFSVFNIGKASTGIVDIFIVFEVKNKPLFTVNPNVGIVYQDKTISHASFNVTAGHVETVKLSSKIKYNEESEIIFQKLDPIKITVISNDIYGKNHLIFEKKLIN